jgi:hypothetical protein
MALLFHHRPELARRLAEDLMAKNPFSDAPNGLFLAAPRRTGKSNFLQFDLQPELTRCGCLVVYVDFRAKSTREPAQVLLEAIASKAQKIAGTSIPQILELLSAQAGCPIVLILDEAPQALTTEAGESAMFALKSARDQLNSPDNRRLLLVFCGSDRDKLLRLVNSANAPFYGSQIHHLPELDRCYVERVADALEKIHPWFAPINVDQLFAAFKAVGLRPQVLNQVLERVLQGPQTNHVQAGNDILAGALQVEQAETKERRQWYLGLKPLEQYVLWRMLAQGPAFRPYDADSRAFYCALLGRKVSTPMAQGALVSLRDQNPSVVWKSSRGEYAVDDTVMQTWFIQEREAGTWPPNPDRAELLRRLTPPPPKPKELAKPIRRSLSPADAMGSDPFGSLGENSPLL